MKRSCNYTSLTSIARTVKGLLNFYLSRKQMPFLKEQKQKAKLARNCPKCNSGVSKLYNFLGEAHHTPQGVPPSHTYSNLALCAKVAALPPFLVPAIASVVLAISNLNKNPDRYHYHTPNANMADRSVGAQVE